LAPRGRADRPPDGRGLRAISKSGLDFARVADVQIPGRRRWLDSAQSEGEVIIFFGTDDPASPCRDARCGGVWSATGAGCTTWKHIAALPRPGANPGAVKLRATNGCCSSPARLRNDPPPRPLR